MHLFGFKQSDPKNQTTLLSFRDTIRNALLVFASALTFTLPASAEDSEVQDMSDPLAVYTQVGAGATNYGINFKVGQAYDTGNPKTIAMNVLEFEGVLGEALGWSGGSQRDNRLDGIRFRNFGVNLENGRGAQVDVKYNLDSTPLAEESGNVSYSLIQALPKMGAVSLYPLLGAGIDFGNNVLDIDDSSGSPEVDEGYSIQGTFGLIGMYGKLAISDKIWLNYNPFYFSTLSGSKLYKDNAYGIDEGSILTHEFVASYQFTPRFNTRYFANWNENTDFSNGGHRIEANYQL
jgi:hypothetical protein